MPSRRTHAKSRLGCLQCKQRRVKCDEKVPRCGSCTKHNIACRYTGSVYSSNQQSLDTEERSSSESSYVSPPSPYSKSPSSTGSGRLSTTTPSKAPELQEIWKTVIPKEALSHRFLMHGLLTLSALHLIEINSGDKGPSRMMYMEIATRHQSLALSSFRPELNSITPLNCNALFAFSSFLSVFAFASSQCMGIEQGMTPVEEIVQAFSLLRGVSEILRTAWDWIEKGQLGPLVRNAATSTTGAVSAEARAALDHLDEVNNDNRDSEAKEACCAAIHKLRESFASFYSQCLQVRIAMWWPISVPPAYIVPLKSRQPMALVILAHYCVILRWVERCWWLTGWSEKLVEEIYQSLDASWRPSIRWPVKIVGLVEKGISQ
ncbi:hypothetical protein V1515DRAFT_616472 [Lipomyces mesembrius]